MSSQGWDVSSEAKHKQGHIDIDATNYSTRLIVEVKGETESSGTGVDILFGQILRRMWEAPERLTRYALVVPEPLLAKVNRVEPWVSERLGIELFTVSVARVVSPREVRQTRANNIRPPASHPQV